MPDREPDAVLVLPADETAPATCRAALAGLASAAGVPDAVLDDLKVVLSEVILNAISHGASDSLQVRVELSASDGSVRVVVLDGGAGLRPGRVDGTGMSVLRGLTDRWEMADRTDAPGVRVAFSKRI